MKTMSFDVALRRLLDALEAELLRASDDEIRAVVAQTGMNAKALLAEAGIATAFKTASPLEERSAMQRETPRPQRARGARRLSEA